MKLPQRLSARGPVIDYLLHLKQQAKVQNSAPLNAKADEAISAVQRVLQTDDGAILLELLEKSTQDYFLSPMEDARALDALNAQRFIALDLRRILADEIQTVMDRQADLLASRRVGRTTGRSGSSPD
jgi:hypothetical protein